MARNEPLGDDCREKFSRDWGIAYAWFRTYNEAMFNWLSCINLGKPDVANDVPVLFSTPERAFADTVRPRVEGQVDIPLISFTLTGAEFDFDRFKPSSLLFSKQQVGDRWQLGKRAMPWELNYNVSVWTKFYEDLDIIGYYLMSRFTPKSYLLVNGRASEVSFTGHSDNSDLEPGVDEDRKLRHDYQFKVDAWMSLPFTEVGSVQRAIVVLQDNEDFDDPIDDIDDPTIANPVIENFTEEQESAETSNLPNKIPGVYTSEVPNDQD